MKNSKNKIAFIITLSFTLFLNSCAKDAATTASSVAGGLDGIRITDCPFSKSKPNDARLGDSSRILTIFSSSEIKAAMLAYEEGATNCDGPFTMKSVLDESTITEPQSLFTIDENPQSGVEAPEHFTAIKIHLTMDTATPPTYSYLLVYSEDANVLYQNSKVSNTAKATWADYEGDTDYSAFIANPTASTDTITFRKISAVPTSPAK